MVLTSFGSVMLLFIISLFNISVSAFSFSEFEITWFDIESPFQANPSSITNTTLSFIFSDKNTPKNKPAVCYVTWAVGLDPPSGRIRRSCSDDSIHFSFPNGTYKGVADFQLEIVHTYQDDSLGEPPWNYNTLYGYLNLTYGTAEQTPGYNCNMKRALCRSEPGATLLAQILYAFAK